MAETTNKSDPKDVTPEKWNGPEDARTKKGAGVYPNYYTQRTRSGHVFTMDDSEGHESVTLQHRSGSMVQFMPDGAVQFVAQNGQYTFVFGENRVKITGAYDVTVEGAASLRVKGDYNTTVMGNYNTTVNGDMNMTAKNFNAQIRGDMDVNAKNMNMKVEGSSTISSHEQTNITSDGGVQLASTSDSVAIGAAKDIGMKAKGKFMMESRGPANVKTEGKLNMQSTGKASLKSSGTVAIEGPSAIHLNTSGQADDADSAVVALKKPTDPNRA